ncbi:HET-domain-containing protein [Corynespora cassiicola Philippines]|uniref:HET-domain-containing protein n=1 Tax=Corynespora cassiicola Philippines TaxID=1448308 RepID=A0A2T2NF70_CORCC|nr:HET-domain-containing protein [Corynespora cassiicola Philippines]
MWLINCRSLELHEFLGSQIPPYAILSHRWEDEEVTFEDIRYSGSMWQRSYKKKHGYRKIKECCAMALSHVDGGKALEYAWIDTCCINKSSSAELTEAINSMYQWYKDSAVCFAYLSDVHVDSPTFSAPASSGMWSKLNNFENDTRNTDQFTASKWFTRGWTLQELLAPSNMVFFGDHRGSWVRIGTKTSLLSFIAKQTGVDTDTLRGQDIRQSSVAARMSWMADRTTTREEDMAYCLLGLFDVNMPLLYGEGGKAFIRLQEEIMRNSDDQTLFAWDMDLSPRMSKNLLTGLLAESPQQFRNARNCIPLADRETLKPYFMTNRGLQIELPLIKLDGIHYLAVLQCVQDTTSATLLGLMLERLGKSDSRFARSGKEHGGVVAVPYQRTYQAIATNVFVKQAPDETTPQSKSIEVNISYHGSYSCIRIYPDAMVRAIPGIYMNPSSSFTIDPACKRAFFIFAQDVDALLDLYQTYMIVLFIANAGGHSLPACKTVSITVPIKEADWYNGTTRSTVPMQTNIQIREEETTSLPTTLHQKWFLRILQRYIGHNTNVENSRRRNSTSLNPEPQLEKLIDDIFELCESGCTSQSFHQHADDCFINAEINFQYRRGQPKHTMKIRIGDWRDTNEGPYELP